MVGSVRRRWSLFLVGDRTRGSTLISTTASVGPQDTSGDHTRPPHTEREGLTLKETSRVSTEITELIDLDTSLEPEDTFDVTYWMTVGLEKPETEELVVKAVEMRSVSSILVYLVLVKYYEPYRATWWYDSN